MTIQPKTIALWHRDALCCARRNLSACGPIGKATGATDKGHLMAHSMGGSLDINVFPQRPGVNRGRTEEGKRYRAMERYAARNPGSFVFSRLIYGDDTWVPQALEYGILLPEPRLWVERFPN